MLCHLQSTPASSAASCPSLHLGFLHLLHRASSLPYCPPASLATTPAESASQGSTRETGAESLHSQPLVPLNAVREQLASLKLSQSPDRGRPGNFGVVLCIVFGVSAHSESGPPRRVHYLLWGPKSLTRTHFIIEGLPKGGHSGTHTRSVPHNDMVRCSRTLEGVWKWGR